MSIHDIASSLQRKLRSEFPLSMLSEKSFNIEAFLSACYSGRSTEVLDTSKSLKKDLESFLDSTEKSLSHQITQDFDKLISIPSLMLNLETQISDLFESSLKFSGTLSKLLTEATVTSEKIIKFVENQSKEEAEHQSAVNSQRFSQSFAEMLEKLSEFKDFSSKSPEIKVKIYYGPMAERISRLIAICEQSGNHPNLNKKKSEFLSLLQKELIFYSTHPEGSLNFRSFLQSYINLHLESEAQIILKDYAVFPIVKKFLPFENSLIDDGFDMEEFYNNVKEEILNGELKLFAEHAECCGILTKSLWKAALKALLTKPKLFSPVFSQDYQRYLKSSLAFSDFLDSFLSHSIRDSSDFSEFLEKWNLSTFFELKKTEIIKPLLQPLKSETLFDFYSLSPNEIYQKSMTQCLENIVLPELYPKFLRLLFQVLSTYCNFITRKFNSQAKAKGITTEDLLNTLKDICSLKDFTQHLQLPPLVKQELLTSLQQLLDPCIRALIESISKLCQNNLESIRSIPSAYRMTNRSMPTVASGFVSSFLQPLKVMAVDIIPKERIINKVLLSYIEIVRETRLEISKAEELIIKYNPDSKDTEKMQKQLELDNQELIKDLASLGFTNENNEIIRQIISINP